MPLKKQQDLADENAELRRRLAELEQRLTQAGTADPSELSRVRQLDAFQLLSRELVTELNLQALLSLIVRRVAELVEGGHGTVWLWDDASETLVLETPISHETPGQRLRRGEGIAGIVALHREGLVVNEYRTWPHARPDILPLVLVLTCPKFSATDEIILSSVDKNGYNFDCGSGGGKNAERKLQNMTILGTKFCNSSIHRDNAPIVCVVC